MKVFLSHSSIDKPFVRAFAKVLKENGIDYWLDESELNFGDSLIRKVSESIDSVTHVVAFLSRHSVQSSWVKFELELADTGEIQGKRITVIPVLIEPCEIPIPLRHKVFC
jgi:membrane-associated protease RseP (regulator of RpoE activity)